MELPSASLLISLAASAGAWLGNRVLKKVTWRFLQAVVGVMLLGIALALGAGII
jgi:uncharacterized membrane protein YfcA